MHPYLLPTPDNMQHSVKYDFLYEYDRPLKATNDYVVPVNDNCRCQVHRTSISTTGHSENEHSMASAYVIEKLRGGRTRNLASTIGSKRDL